MQYEILPITAEHIVNVTDAVLLKHNGCDKQFVASFLDITEDSAQNALKMAEQIGLITQDVNNQYIPLYKFASYLVTSNEQQKANIMRLILEEYEPYKMFKRRLAITGSVFIAAEQVKVFFSLTPHRDVIKDTLTNLGTYSHSLISEGAGLYKIPELNNSASELFISICEIVAERERADLLVRKMLGTRAQDWMNGTDIINNLITAYQKLFSCEEDPRGPILYAGNAFESFLSKYADTHTISLTGTTGINAKVEKIAQAGKLNTKYKFVSKYIGHVRNACDHGIDGDIGQEWQVLPETSKEFVLITITSIKNIIESIFGVFNI